MVVANKKDYPQRDLSEKLANAGLLPMFGFPTRVRLLYEKKPGKLPAIDVVDRNLDIAISSFAPGSETVKDKKVLTSVGFISYYMKNVAVVEMNGLNELEADVKICKTCGFTTISEEYNISCDICGGNVESVKACSPLGFCIDYEADIKDFNGRFDWMPFATNISLDGESNLNFPNEVHNLFLQTNILPKEGLVHQINTNDGKLFKIGKLTGSQIYCARDAFSEDKRKALQIFEEQEYALIASKNTGILTASILSINENIDLNPFLGSNSTGHAIRASFISWGFLLRKSICNFLDIESSEIDVGFRINKNRQGEIFIVEKLENGAGYCNYISGRLQADIPKKALIDPLQQNGQIYSMLADEIETEHKKNCSSSCYDCLRDFYNQQYHSILDWRLGLDLAKVAFDKNFVPDFTVEYWKPYFNELIDQLTNRMKGKKYEISKEVYVIEKGKSFYLISHPFWSGHYIKTLQNKFNSSLSELNIFDAIRKVKK